MYDDIAFKALVFHIVMIAHFTRVTNIQIIAAQLIVSDKTVTFVIIAIIVIITVELNWMHFNTVYCTYKCET